MIYYYSINYDTIIILLYYNKLHYNIKLKYNIIIILINILNILHNVKY